MQKLLVKIVALILVVATGLLTTGFAGGGVQNIDSETLAPELILYSEECPAGVKEYATEAYIRLVQGAVESGSLVLSGDVSLGSPFTIYGSESNSTVYYFPIINNNSVVATFRVYMDEVQTEASESNSPIYTGILSKHLADELNTLQAETTQETPVLIYADNGNIMVRIGNKCNLLVPASSGDLPESIETGVGEAEENLQTISVYNALNTTQVSAIQTLSDTAAVLNLSIIETQHNNSWCGAYATATIIRYLRGSSTSPKAQDLMEMFYDVPCSSDSLSIDDVLEVGESYGYSPVFVNSTLNSTQVFNQIDAKKPIYASLRRYVDAEVGYAYHAVVLCGYNKRTDTYSIWNPWDDGYETMDMTSKQYVASSTRTYTWCRTIYDW